MALDKSVNRNYRLVIRVADKVRQPWFNPHEFHSVFSGVWRPITRVFLPDSHENFFSFFYLDFFFLRISIERNFLFKLFSSSLQWKGFKKNLKERINQEKTKKRNLRKKFAFFSPKIITTNEKLTSGINNSIDNKRTQDFESKFVSGCFFLNPTQKQTEKKNRKI